MSVKTRFIWKWPRQGVGQSAQEAHSGQPEAAAQALASRSPTPDLAVPSATAPAQPALDTDMTLPWYEPQDQLQPLTAATAGNVTDHTQANEPLHGNNTLLPDTQVTDMPHVATVQAMEPTQIAQLPDAPSSPPTSSKLASAAAQAMTGAHTTQASGLPSSVGFATSMPSLALPDDSAPPKQHAAAATQQKGRTLHGNLHIIGFPAICLVCIYSGRRMVMALMPCYATLRMVSLNLHIQVPSS